MENSIKEKIKELAKERETTFAELWRNLILERFLSRLAISAYRDKFVLKGGTLLAKYIPIGRQTQDLDFFIQKVSNTEQSLRMVLQAICDVETNDNFAFEVFKIKTSLKKLPVAFSKSTFQKLEKNWNSYLRKFKTKENLLPESIEEIIFFLNQWLNEWF